MVCPPQARGPSQPNAGLFQSGVWKVCQNIALPQNVSTICAAPANVARGMNMRIHIRPNLSALPLIPSVVRPLLLSINLSHTAHARNNGCTQATNVYVQSALPVPHCKNSAVGAGSGWLAPCVTHCLNRNAALSGCVYGTCVHACQVCLLPHACKCVSIAPPQGWHAPWQCQQHSHGIGAACASGALILTLDQKRLTMWPASRTVTSVSPWCRSK